MAMFGAFAFVPHSYTEAALLVIGQASSPSYAPYPTAIDATITRDRCAQLCAARTDCKVASWCDATTPGGWPNTCVLRSAADGKHVLQGVVSWVKP